VNIFGFSENFHKHLIDCLSWFIHDAAYILATFVTKIKQTQPPVKDRGAKLIYEEMIQSWMLYEVVKVLYLFGLNPGINKACEKTAPEIYNYLTDMENGSVSAESVELNNISFRKTKHRSNFIGDKTETTFAHIKNTSWVADVQHQLPFLILTRMRQLQQIFFEDEKVRWNSCGRYAPTTKPTADQRTNPLTAIHFTAEYGSDIQNMKLTEIINFSDIIPQEPKGNPKQLLCRSLEEWAMLLFKPAVPERLENAMNEDSETKQRYNNLTKKITEHNHLWNVSDTDYSGYGGQRTNNSQVEDIEKVEDYKNKEPEDLQYILVNSFIEINNYAQRAMEKKKTTKLNIELFNTTNKGISAYMALVNKNNKGDEEDALEITDLKTYRKILKKTRKQNNNQSQEEDSDNESDNSGE
jgi:hypothetical protein